MQMQRRRAEKNSEKKSALFPSQKWEERAREERAESTLMSAKHRERAERDERREPTDYLGYSFFPLFQYDWFVVQFRLLITFNSSILRIACLRLQQSMIIQNLHLALQILPQSIHTVIDWQLHLSFIHIILQNRKLNAANGFQDSWCLRWRTIR